MDETESIAKRFLGSRGFTTIDYEPDGNVPPDFVCDYETAVEVRRLNKNLRNGNRQEGLETTAVPVVRLVKKILESYGPPVGGQSWFVLPRFRRPGPNRQKTEKLIRDRLDLLLSSSAPKAFDEILAHNLQLKLFASSTEGRHLFELAGYNDLDSSGFIVDDIVDNLDYVLDEKHQKILKYKGNYLKWWLVLPNYISPFLYPEDKYCVSQRLEIRSRFDKVVLLDPRNSTVQIELPS